MGSACLYSRYISVILTLWYTYGPGWFIQQTYMEWVCLSVASGDANHWLVQTSQYPVACINKSETNVDTETSLIWPQHSSKYAFHLQAKLFYATSCRGDFTVFLLGPMRQGQSAESKYYFCLIAVFSWKIHRLWFWRFPPKTRCVYTRNGG